MFITIVSYILAAAVPFCLYTGYLRFINRNIPTVLTESPKIEEPQSGLSVYEYVIPPETESEYLTRLKTIHPDAWTDYEENYSSHSLHEVGDRFVNLLILKYRNGEITAKCSEHTLDFSEGTSIWISNKYYAYGNIHHCKRAGMRFESDMNHLSPYTFMSVVDLEFELKEFDNWKNTHDVYSRSRKNGIKKLLRK